MHQKPALFNLCKQLWILHKLEINSQLTAILANQESKLNAWSPLVQTLNLIFSLETWHKMKIPTTETYVYLWKVHLKEFWIDALRFLWMDKKCLLIRQQEKK